MIKLSVVIITFNEENNIGRCIDSVKEIADEVLIVDSYSTDNTKKISVEKGAEFIEKKFEGFGKQKQFAVDQASHDYILSLDADEALDKQGRKIIESLKNKFHSDAFELNRITNYCGKWIKHCGWYPDKKIRLFNRKKALWNESSVHESIVLKEGALLKRLNLDILHFSFPTIASHAKTANSFSEIAAKEAIKNKKNVNFIIHVLLNPLFTFLKKYFFQLGFLDGYYGLIICILSSHSNFLKYSKIWQLNRENSNIQNR